MKTMGTFLMMGEPTEEILHELLSKAGYEDTLTAPLSKIVMEYVRTRNFQQVASHFGLHRPDVRRVMSRASKALMESTEPKEAAIAAWLHSLIDKVSPLGTGASKRRERAQGHIYRADSEIIGWFRIPIEHPDIGQMFVSSANR